MNQRRVCLVAVGLLASTVILLAEQFDKPHEPVYGAELRRSVVPVEITFKDGAGAPVVIDRHARTNAHTHQMTRLEGDYSWDVPCRFDKLRGVLSGGSASEPGLEPGEYEISMALGRYGAVRETIIVNETGCKQELRAPLTRKTIKLRFVDETGEPLVAVPHRPRFEEEVVYNSVRDDVLPDPVLRLPPSRVDSSLGKGGFGYRRARGGTSPVVLLDDGWCHATVFDGGEGVLKVPLNKDDFGIDVYELAAPFDQAEYTVKLTPSKQWCKLDLEKRGVVNKDDPGLIEYNEPEKATETTNGKVHSVKFILSPTVHAWARYAHVEQGSHVYGVIGAKGIGFPVELEAIETLFLSSSSYWWPKEWTSYPSDDYVRFARRNRADDRSVCLSADSDGLVTGVFARLLDAKGRAARFVEVSIFPLSDDEVAQGMRKREVELDEAGKRPPPGASLPEETQQALREAESSGNEADVKAVMHADTFASLGKLEYRLRYARFSAWYDSHQRIDGDEDGYLVAPHFTLKDDELYVMYIWHTSRNDLEPDARLVIRGQGETTDLGVIRLSAR